MKHRKSKVKFKPTDTGIIAKTNSVISNMALAFERRRIELEAEAKRKTVKKGLSDSKKSLVSLLIGKRGSRFYDPLVCSCCQKTVPKGWRYLLNGEHMYLCSTCKDSIKPQKISYTTVVNPVGNGKNR